MMKLWSLDFGIQGIMRPLYAIDFESMSSAYLM